MRRPPQSARARPRAGRGRGATRTRSPRGDRHQFALRRFRAPASPTAPTPTAPRRTPVGLRSPNPTQPAAAAGPDRRRRTERRQAREVTLRPDRDCSRNDQCRERYPALTRRSAGRLSAALRGFRHQIRDATMTASLSAKTQKGTATPERRDDQAAERRPGRAPDIEADPVQGRRAVQILLGHEERNCRAPGGRGQRSAHSEQEGRRQQERRRRKAQRHQAGEDRRRPRGSRVRPQSRAAERSMTSASAPAGKVKRKSGRLTAT